MTDKDKQIEALQKELKQLREQPSEPFCKSCLPIVGMELAKRCAAAGK